MTPIPRGLHSTRQHEPLDPERVAMGRPPAPERQTVLEDAIVGVLQTVPGPRAESYADACLRQARRILKIDRIAKALKLMDDVDSGAVELMCVGSQIRRESSDER